MNEEEQSMCISELLQILGKFPQDHYVKIARKDAEVTYTANFKDAVYHLKGSTLYLVIESDAYGNSIDFV